MNASRQFIAEATEIGVYYASYIGSELILLKQTANVAIELTATFQFSKLLNI